jgi:hypothetical protein
VKLRTKLAVAAIPLLGLAIASSGILPLAASSGHFAPTRWLIEFTKRRTVKVRSSGISKDRVPALEDPAMVRLGAGYFHIGCRSCHEPPGAPPARALRFMLPRPAHLDREARPQIHRHARMAVAAAGR